MLQSVNVVQIIAKLFHNNREINSNINSIICIGGINN